MQIKFVSVMVDDQEKALRFYTEVLGFTKMTFRGEPKAMGPITAVNFEDTCGNLINLVEPKS